MEAQYSPPIGSRAELADLIDILKRLGPPAAGRVMLFSALYQREICLQEALAGGPVSTIKRSIRTVGNRPSAALIGDDDDLDHGPSGFFGAAKAIAWGWWFLVHGAGAKAMHYAAAIEAAHLYRVVVVIECSSLTLPEWEALAARAPNQVGGVIVRPRGGVHHPLGRVS